MGGFGLLEHTADIGIVAAGDTFADALAWLARGMFSVITELEKIQPSESIEVLVESMDRDALVVDWLNELLYRYDAEGFLPKDFHVRVDDAESSLKAECEGERVDTERHTMLLDVKAATYHELDVSHKDGEWRIQVVLDV